MLIDGTPEVMLLAIDLEKHLVAVPLVAGLCTPTAQLIGKLLTKLEAPLPHRFLRHEPASRSQQLFDVTIAEVEAMIEPHRVGDNVLGKAKPFVRWSSDVGCHATSIA